MVFEIPVRTPLLGYLAFQAQSAVAVLIGPIQEVFMLTAKNILTSVLKLTSLILFLFAIPLPVHSAGNENNAVAFCVAAGATEPEAFAVCVGTYLTRAEIKKCLTGGDCFGKSNDLRLALERTGINFAHIEQYGPCGGANSVARAIFGNANCGGCTGPERNVKIENRTNDAVYFYAEGSCSSGTSLSVPAGMTVTISGPDDWFNVTARGGTKTAVDIGMTYAFQWTTRQRPPALNIVDITPRYKP